MAMKVSEIFQVEPEQWGLRGDPYLWRELKTRLRNMDMPDAPEMLRSLLEREFEDAVGCSVAADEEFVVIERLKHGGMSSGAVSLGFWSTIGIPLLVGRHERS